MNANLTPGPWQNVVGNGAGDFWYVHRKTDTEDGGYFCRIDALHRTEEARGIARANARLIAAAPELLAACQYALDRHNYQGTGEPWPEVFDVLRSAVAKATGDNNA